MARSLANRSSNISVWSTSVRLRYTADKRSSGLANR
jgi:hypothetical protein